MSSRPWRKHQDDRYGVQTGGGTTLLYYLVYIGIAVTPILVLLFP